jgi:hypothetical protein
MTASKQLSRNGKSGARAAMTLPVPFFQARSSISSDGSMPTTCPAAPTAAAAAAAAAPVPVPTSSTRSPS